MMPSVSQAQPRPIERERGTETAFLSDITPLALPRLRTLMQRSVSAPLLWMHCAKMSDSNRALCSSLLSALDTEPSKAHLLEARFVLQSLIVQLIQHGYEVTITGSQARNLLKESNEDEHCENETDIDISVSPRASKAFTGDIGPLNQARTQAVSLVLSQLLSTSLYDNLSGELKPAHLLQPQQWLEAFVAQRLFEGEPLAQDYRGLLRVGPDLDLNVPFSEARSYCGAHDVRVKLGTTLGNDGRPELSLKTSQVSPCEGSLFHARFCINNHHLTSALLSNLNTGLLVKMWLHAGMGGSVSSHYKSAVYQLLAQPSSGFVGHRTPAQICAFNLLKKIQEPKYQSRALGILSSTILDIVLQNLSARLSEQLIQLFVAKLKSLATRQSQPVQTFISQFCADTTSLKDQSPAILEFFLQRSTRLQAGFTLEKRVVDAPGGAYAVSSLTFENLSLLFLCQAVSNQQDSALERELGHLPRFLSELLTCDKEPAISCQRNSAPESIPSGMCERDVDQNKVIEQVQPAKEAVDCSPKIEVMPAPVQQRVPQPLRRRKQKKSSRTHSIRRAKQEAKKDRGLIFHEKENKGQYVRSASVPLASRSVNARSVVDDGDPSQKAATQQAVRRALKKRAQPPRRFGLLPKVGVALSLMGAWELMRSKQPEKNTLLPSCQPITRDTSILKLDNTPLAFGARVSTEKKHLALAPTEAEAAQQMRLDLLFRLPIDHDIRLSLLPLFYDEVACVPLEINESQTLNFFAALTQLRGTHSQAHELLSGLTLQRISTGEDSLTLAYWRDAVSDKVLQLSQQSAWTLNTKEIEFLKTHSDHVLQDILMLLSVRGKNPVNEQTRHESHAPKPHAPKPFFSMDQWIQVICGSKNERPLSSLVEAGQQRLLHAHMKLGTYALIEGHRFFRAEIHSQLQHPAWQHIQIGYPQLHDLLAQSQTDPPQFGTFKDYAFASQWLKKVSSLYQVDCAQPERAQALINLMPVLTGLSTAIYYPLTGGTIDEKLKQMVAQFADSAHHPHLQWQALGTDALLIFDVKQVNYAAWQINGQLPINHHSSVVTLANHLDGKHRLPAGKLKTSTLDQFFAVLVQGWSDQQRNDTVYKQPPQHALAIDLPEGVLEEHVKNILSQPHLQSLLTSSQDQFVVDQVKNQCLNLFSLLSELPLSAAQSQQLLPVVLGLTPAVVLDDLNREGIQSLSDALRFYQPFYPHTGFPLLAQKEGVVLFYRDDQLASFFNRFKGTSVAQMKQKAQQAADPLGEHNILQKIVDQMPAASAKLLLMQVESQGYFISDTDVQPWQMINKPDDHRHELAYLMAQYSQARRLTQTSLVRTELVQALSQRLHRTRSVVPKSTELKKNVLNNQLRHPFWRELTESDNTFAHTLGLDPGHAPSFEALAAIANRGIALGTLSCSVFGRQWLAQISPVVLGLHPATLIQLPDEQLTSFVEFLNVVNTHLDLQLVSSPHQMNDEKYAVMVCTLKHSQQENFALAKRLLDNRSMHPGGRYVGFRSALDNSDLATILLNWSYNVFIASQGREIDFLPGMLPDPKHDFALFQVLQTIATQEANLHSGMILEANPIYIRLNVKGLQLVLQDTRDIDKNTQSQALKIQTLKHAILQTARDAGLSQAQLFQQLDKILLQVGQFKGMQAAQISVRDLYQQYLIPFTESSQRDQSALVKLAHHIEHDVGF